HAGTYRLGRTGTERPSGHGPGFHVAAARASAGHLQTNAGRARHAGDADHADAVGDSIRDPVGDCVPATHAVTGAVQPGVDTDAVGAAGVGRASDDGTG